MNILWQEAPEESAADKIYASLRECREQADPKRQKGVKMQGFLNKKKGSRKIFLCGLHDH